MSRSMALSLELALRQMEITNPLGVTVSIFPAVEAWLQDSDRMNALDWVAGRKKAGRYASVVDFLNAEINTEWRTATLYHYHSETPKLGSLIDGRTRDRLEGRILLALEIAYQAHCEKRRLSWSHLVECTDEVELELAS